MSDTPTQSKDTIQRLRPIGRLLWNFFAVIGILASTIYGLGLKHDIANFDRTKGGYEPPYEGWTGEPLDYDSWDQNATGLVQRGKVGNVHLNGATGMVTYEVYGIMIPWRKLSERAIVVHKPREALIRRGFKPEF